MIAGGWRRAVAVGLLAGALSTTSGCAGDAADSATPPSATATATCVATAAAPAAGSDDRGGKHEGGDDGGRRGGGHGTGSGRGGDDDAAPPAMALPAGFPADVPLPPGQLQAASGAGEQWSAVLRVPGSPPDALRATMQFYVAAGFTQDSPATAHRGPDTVTLMSPDHDDTRTVTTLVVGITAR
jgi:hypothetical protein